MSYVDGFVVPVSRDKIDAYKAQAQKAGEVWKEYGALAFVEAGAIEPHHLRFVSPPSEDAGVERLQLGGHSLVRLERVAIRQTLQQVRGNKVHAAKILGIAPSTLYEKVKKYGL